MELVLDWDGTCTEVDGLHMLLEEFGDREIYEHMEGALGAGLTLHEVIAAEIATIKLPLDFAVGWMREHVTMRPGFKELAESTTPIVLSSGFHELIEPVLARLDPLLKSPTRLSTDEFNDLVKFVRDGLSDKRAGKDQLCRLIPSSVPSGMRPLEFEQCRHRR